jgi:hypothetical protein
MSGGRTTLKYLYIYIYIYNQTINRPNILLFYFINKLHGYT